LNFDLLLYRPERNLPLTEADTDKAMSAIANIQKRPGTAQYWYENPATCVCFSFQLGTPKPGTIPFKIEGLGFYFSISYIRPTFFALESMSIVIQVAQQLDLLIASLSEEKSDIDQNPDKLVEMWSNGNIWAMKTLSAERRPASPIIYSPADRLNYWWRYMYGRGFIEQQYRGAGIFIPSEIGFYRRNGAKEACQIADWFNGALAVLPEVDYLRVKREIRSLFGLRSRMERGMVPCDEVRRLLKPYLQQINKPVSCWVYNDSASQQKIRKRVAVLNFIPEDQFQPVAVESIVDVRI
jgi:hypothetical protein